MTKTRLVQTNRFIVVVDVEAVIPEEDPTEVCYEPETVELLHEIEHRAECGDIDWLMAHGRVYKRVEAA